MSQQALPGIFGAMAPVLDHYGYLAVGLLITLEDFGVPVPGETVLIAASLYAGAGRMNVVAVGVIGFLAATVGDNIGYLIGRFGGRALAARFGKYVFLTSERLRRAEVFFERQGGKIIIVARFIEGLRQANGIVAGITRMPWRRFAVFNAIGAALWVAVWVSAGDLAGSHIITIYDQATRYSVYVLIAAVVAVAGLIAWHLRRHVKRRPAADAGGPPAPGDAPASPDDRAARDAPAPPSAPDYRAARDAPAPPSARATGNAPAPADPPAPGSGSAADGRAGPGDRAAGDREPTQPRAGPDRQ